MSSNKVPSNSVGLGALIVGLAILVIGLCTGGALLFQSRLSGTRAPSPMIAPVIVSAPTASASDTPTSTGTPSPAPSSTPTTVPTVEVGTSNVFIEYILDASGSMTGTLSDGSVKIDLAKRVLTDHMRSFRPETNIGLRAFGHRLPYQQTAESCQDIELIAPVQKGQMERIVGFLQDFEAHGMTPLAASLQQAKEDFVYEAPRINSIILLSDGIETCRGDPCKLVGDLKAQRINFTIHVIGLDVDDSTREQLFCIAQAGGGTYHDAKSQLDLSAALNAVKAASTKDEIVVPPGVDTPTPAPPTETPLPPSDTPLPPTNTSVPPTVTTGPSATPMLSTPTPTPTERPVPLVGDNEVLFRGTKEIGSGFSTECYSSPCPGEGDMNNAPQVFCTIAVTEVVSGDMVPGSQVFVQVKRDATCSGQNYWEESCPPLETHVSIFGHWTQWPRPVQLPPNIVGIVEICSNPAYFMVE